MIISCSSCQTKYRVDENNIAHERFRVQCKQCGESFIVDKETGKSTSENQSVSATSAASGGTNAAASVSSDCIVITVCNQKGGVAKTSSCLNLGASLALLKKRVLLVDFDVQSNLSLLLGFSDVRSFFDVMHSEDAQMEDCVLQAKPNLWILPSNNKMALLSKKHLGSDRFEYLLHEQLASIKSKFDYIIIDTPPSGDFYTLNALLASNLAIVATQCEFLSMNGVSHIEDLISVIKDKADHDIDYQILITMYKSDNTASRAVLKKMMATYNGRILKPAITYDEKIQESQIVQQPTLYYDKTSRAGRQYLQLAKSLVNVE